MNAFILVFILGICMFLGYRWAFANLPAARWQMLAAVPTSLDGQGRWRGINFTYYGVFNALSYTLATAIVLLLCGSINIPGDFLLIVVAAVLGICIPSSSLVAKIVEKKPHTLSVGGAVFVGTLISPWIVWLARSFFTAKIDVIAVLAAISIAYALGEGTGRLACLSFGCCYGRPLDSLSPVWRRRLQKYAIIFEGPTKKACYASGFEGRPLVPIQAMTAVLYSACALLGMLLFFYGYFIAALWLAMLTTQVWRFYSEFLRSDYRGGGRFSAYQKMSLVCAGYSLLLPLFFVSSLKPVPDVLIGLNFLWTPGMILGLQALALVSFWFTGKSDVTGSELEFFVFEDRV